MSVKEQPDLSRLCVHTITTKPWPIETAMKAVQDAEKKTKEELADAQKQLKAAVNMRQQAVLVALGILN